MAIFHVVGKPYLTILVSNFQVVQMIENVFDEMFVFLQGSMHISKDDYYRDANIILSYVYQILNVNLGGMF
jgi:hypothetical protein